MWVVDMKLCDFGEYKEFIEAKEKYTKNPTSDNYIKMQSLRANILSELKMLLSDCRLTYEEFFALKDKLFE